MLGALLAGTFVTGSLAVASPAWAGTSGADAASGCHLVAAVPEDAPRATVRGTGERKECSDTVTYFWVRVCQVIPMWPDYTHTSTATGMSGDSTESSRVRLC